MNRKGFTFIELIVVLGIMMVLVGFASVSLLGAQRKPIIATSVQTLIADIRNQQEKAMNGKSASSFGVSIGLHQYVLFQGSEFNPSDPANSTVTLDSNAFLSTTFPNSTIVFASGSGEIPNFTQQTSTVTVVSGLNQEMKTIGFNRYGIIISLQ